MQNKKARALARQVNINLGLSDPPDGAERKYGPQLKTRGRDFHRICALIERQMRRDDPTLPKEVAATHYAVFQKAMTVALRNNYDTAIAKCPQCRVMVTPICNCPNCGGTVEIQIPSDKLEKNSVMTLVALMDRMAPKLATVTTEINIHNTILNIGTGMAQIVAQYVPNDKRLDCIIAIRALLEAHKHAISDAGEATEINGLSVN